MVFLVTIRYYFYRLQVEKNIASAKMKGKNSETARKVQLMRIKSKAVGPKDVPVAHRVYFNVQEFNTKKDVPVYISKTWTIGKFPFLAPSFLSQRTVRTEIF